MHLVSAILAGAISHSKYSPDDEAHWPLRSPSIGQPDAEALHGVHAAFADVDFSGETSSAAAPAPAPPAAATTKAAADTKAATAKATDAGGVGTKDKGAEGENKDSNWDYYMSGTGLLFWLGPLVCIVLVGALAAGGKYYREQAKKQARFEQHHSIVAPPRQATIVEVHRRTVLTKQQTAALEDRDVRGLCDLLGDQTPLEGEQAEPHPWAKAPQTVGALAGMHIASLAAEDPYGCAAEVHACGGLTKFVGFLDESDDRQHCALITLALLAYNDVCAAALVEEQVAEKLVRYNAVGPYQSTTVAIILRYIFFYSEATKSAFVQQHGIAIFTDLLAESAPEIQLTAVTNILDILFGAGGLDNEILSCLQAEPLKAKLAGHLKPMTDSSDPDVKENASYLLETIVGAA